MDDGSQGIDDQFIKSAHGAPDLADHAAQQDLGLLRRDRQVPRPRHAEPTRIRRPPPLCGSRPRITPTAIKWTSPVTSSLLLEAGYSSNTRVLHQQLSARASRSRASPPEWFASASRQRDRPRRLHARPATTRTTQSPEALILAGVAATYVTGDAHASRSASRQPLGRLLAHASTPTAT